MIVLEPIFEADLHPEQYAYREQRGAHDAVKAVLNLLRTGHQQVIDADLSGYFDSIPHAELMKCVARRVSDKYVLHLIKMWLDAPVEEEDERGNRKRTTSNRDTGCGTPQGAVISPLLSNLYMRRFILGWKKLGHARHWSAHIVNYADDFVICCKGQAEEAMAAMREMMVWLKLTVNEDKTHVCRAPQERFDFLGYARVSTLDQDPTMQLDALAAAGCTRVFEDRASGARADRPGLQKALDYVRDGDVLIVWKLDRLGRSLPHLITGQVVPINPAAAVRGPKHVVKTGKTPVLDAPEWRKLLDSIPTETVRDLRDRALIATLTYSFSRITAALTMKVEDLRSKGAGWADRAA